MRFSAFFLIGSLLLAPGVLIAGINLGDGGAISLGQGQIDLAGGDLRIDGNFSVASGRLLRAGSLILTGGLDGGSGEIEVGGDWINDGQFTPGAGWVRLTGDVDGMVSISGESDFANLALINTAGAVFVLDSGLEQRVADSLIIQGGVGLPVQIQSDTPPQPAFLWLADTGSQDITQVGVSNVHATGQPLAPDQTNQGGSGNALGWFGQGFEIIPVPALSLPALALLILTLMGLTAFRLSGQRA